MLLRLCLVFAYFRKIPLPEEIMKMRRRRGSSSASDGSDDDNDNDDDDDDGDNDNVDNVDDNEQNDNASKSDADKDDNDNAEIRSSSPRRGKRGKNDSDNGKHKRAKRKAKTQPTTAELLSSSSISSLANDKETAERLKNVVVKLLAELKELWLEINMQLDLSGKLGEYITVRGWGNNKNVIITLIIIIYI